MTFAQPPDVADRPQQDHDVKQQSQNDQPESQAWLDQHHARHAKRLAALGISGDDLLGYEPGSAGLWLLQKKEYGGFWDPTNTILQIYGIRSSYPIFAHGVYAHIKADL